MTVTTDRAERTATSAVLPTDGAISVARPLPARDVAILGGLWADRMRTNRERSLAHGYAQLGHAGNLTELPPRGGRAGHLPVTRGADGPRLPVPRHRRLQMARGRRLGARPRPRPGARHLGRRGHRARRGRAAPGWLPEHVRPGRRRRDAVPRPAVGPRAVLLRPPRAGRHRVAPLDRRRPLARDRAPRRRLGGGRARAGRTRRDRRASRGRDGPRGAVPDHWRPAPPRARRVGWSTCAATACWDRGDSGRPTGRTTSRSATRPRSPVTPFARCTSTAAWSTSPWSSATAACSRRS